MLEYCLNIKVMKKNLKKLVVGKSTLSNLEHCKIIAGKSKNTIYHDSCKTCNQRSCKDCPSDGCSINAVYCAIG